jgi:hypothetical protein
MSTTKEEAQRAEAEAKRDELILEWDKFDRKFKWKQGEHVTAIGPTQSGKTTLIKEILPRRKYVCVMITKKRDPLIGEFVKEGYEKMPKWREVPHEVHPRILLHPPLAKDEPKERYQHDEFRYALDRAFDQGHWTLYADELPYLIDELKLERPLKRQWNQGQGMKTSLVASAQRPAFLPLLAYSAATHLFFFRTTDETDLKRLGGLGGVSNKVIREIVMVLESKQFLYLNTRTGDMYISKVNLR